MKWLVHVSMLRLNGGVHDRLNGGDRWRRPPRDCCAKCRRLGSICDTRGRYKAVGITTLFDWQSEALSRPGVMEGTRNLLYTAATSGGKTLVAELLLLKRIESVGCRAKAKYILPLKALVTQKTQDFE